MRMWVYLLSSEQAFVARRLSLSLHVAGIPLENYKDIVKYILQVRQAFETRRNGASFSNVPSNAAVLD